MNIPTELKENEYLLKIRPKCLTANGYDTGFLTKYTQKGLIPRAFDMWGVNQYYNQPNQPADEPLPITLHIEDFKSGWEIVAWRFGMSQNWATMKHPNGFTLEIYLDNLLGIAKTNTIENGVLIGEFKWEGNRLIKK